MMIVCAALLTLHRACARDTAMLAGAGDVAFGWLKAEAVNFSNSFGSLLS